MSTYLRQVHGDVSRLGYLKVLSCIGDDYQPYSFIYFTDRLLELTKPYQNSWDYPDGLSWVGLVESKATSENYVNFSYDFEVLNRKHQTLGSFGRLYRKTTSVESMQDYIRNPKARSRNFLVLSDYERILFLYQLLEIDGLLIRDLLKWFVEEIKERGISRKAAMNHLMEVILPSAIESRLNSAKSYEHRVRLDQELKSVKNYREIRLGIEKSTQKWNTSKQYARYRHFANPRLEWLVDLKLLKKKGRGIFHPTSITSRVENEVSSQNESIFREEAFFRLGEIYSGISKIASLEDIKRILALCYQRFSNAGYIAVDLTLLKKLVAHQLLEILQKRSKISKIDVVLQNLKELDPDCIQYHVDIDGIPRLVKLMTEKIRRLSIG